MRIVTARNAARRNSICAHRTGIITASKAMGVRVIKREKGDTRQQVCLAHKLNKGEERSRRDQEERREKRVTTTASLQRALWRTRPRRDQDRDTKGITTTKR